MTLEDSPRTGLDHLAAALADRQISTQHRSVFTALGLNTTGFARDFAPSLLGLPLYEHVTDEHAEWLTRYRESTARDVFLALQRTLSTCPQTLRALTRRTPGPVHGTERPGLTATVRRVLIAAGYAVDADQAKLLTYRAADSLSRSLDRPLDLPVPDARRELAVDDGPVMDHDFYDWQTWEAKFAPACMAAIEALVAAQDCLAEVDLSIEYDTAAAVTHAA